MGESASDVGVDAAPTEGAGPAQLTFVTLTAMVIGSMVGAGVFSLPRRFATETGVYGALIAWVIAGAGMLMLAFVFQTLAVRKPHLDAGVYAYAKAGFGEYLGFFSAFGYWASACVGNVTYWVLIMSTLGGIFTWLGEGDTVAAVALSSVAIWIFAALVLRGVREATAINKIVTVAKIIPILVFIVLAIAYLDVDVLVDNLTGEGAGSLFSQVRGTMLATVFVFLGIEGASVYSRYAKKREDVGRATVLGFLMVLAIFASVTIVSYGILPREQIAELRQPSMAGVLEAAVGSWGEVFISIGLVVSVLGAYLAWTLMSAEVLFVAARDKDMPRFLSRTNASDSPAAALLLTTALIQLVLLVVLVSENAFDFMLNMTSALSLIPYLLAAGYGLKIARREREHAGRSDLLVAALATLYTVFLLYAAGAKYLLVAFIVYAPGTILFVMARREQGRTLFSRPELVILAVSVLGALAGVVALVTGAITI
ncbi:MAG TPA: basic amino acid/polyamine antiporter [Acidimicrobiales bacterium]|nr:basic amino acid/polyamine antiporter [Acidimicrobiales bacterium]